MNRIWMAGLALLVLGACSKATPTQCGPKNCAGCCDDQGVCQAADASHCGENGLACVACPSGQACIQAVCAVPSGSTGTTGTGATSGSGGTTGTHGATVGTIGTGSSSGGSTGGQDLDAGAADGGDLDGGGTTGSCGFDAGPIQGGSCNPECHSGFHCEGGSCVLNGGNGPIQVTLRWVDPVDLDLHVIEPSGCEVYYGDTNRPPGTSSCGAAGSLDLDSNAGCSIDNVDTENVIYPPSDAGSAAPAGTYTVKVDYFANCSTTQSIPYEVTVRHNGVTDTYCDSFAPGTANGGSAGSGVLITTFTYP